MRPRQTCLSTVAAVFVGSLALLAVSCASSMSPFASLFGGTGTTQTEFTVYSNPADSLLLSAETADGGYLEAYGEKDIEGVPTAVTTIRYKTSDQLENDEATWLSFDVNGDLEQITAEDGSIISFVWTSDTTALITALSADGTTQVETQIDLDDAESAYAAPMERQPDNGVAPRGGQHLILLVVDSPDEFSTTKLRQDPVVSIPKYEQTASGSGELVYVSVTRCDSPVTGAFVSVTLDNPYKKLPNTYTAFPTGTAGLYAATVPVREASNAGQVAEDICNGLEEVAGMGCNLAALTEGQEHRVCLALAAAIDTALAGPTGEGVPILAACEGGFTALKAYCDTLGASAVDGAQSVASYNICGNIKTIVDRAAQDPSDNLALQAWVNVKGLAPAHSVAKTVAPTGPFPSLTVEFPDEGPVIHPVSLSPADPAPGQGYTATVRVECVPENSWTTLSVAGSDGYTDSTSVTIDGGTTLQLAVPGAEAGVADLITVQVGGVSQLCAAVVF